MPEVMYATSAVLPMPADYMHTYMLTHKEFPEHQEAWKGMFYSGIDPWSGLC